MVWNSIRMPPRALISYSSHSTQGCTGSLLRSLGKDLQCPSPPAAWGIQPAHSERSPGSCSLVSGASGTWLAEHLYITLISRPIIALPELADSLLSSEGPTSVHTVELLDT